MSDQAKVTSLDALDELRASLIIFMSKARRSLDDAGTFERRLSLLGSGRNTNVWLLLPFAAFGAWYVGFIALAVYAAVTAAIIQTRLFARLSDCAPPLSSNGSKPRGEEGGDPTFVRRWLSPK